MNIQLQQIYRVLLGLFIGWSVLLPAQLCYGQTEPTKERLDLRNNKEKVSDYWHNFKLQTIRFQYNYCFWGNAPTAIKTKKIFTKNTDKDFASNFPAIDLQFYFGNPLGKDQSWHILVGLGVGFTKYNFRNQVNFIKKSDNELVYEMDTINKDYVQNRISHRYLEIPLQINRRIGSDNFFWENIVSVGWNFQTIYKNKYKAGSISTEERKDISKYMNKLRINLQTGFSLGEFVSIYASWEPIAQFAPSKSAIKTNPFKTGWAVQIPMSWFR
ncbi:Outer membrane protein beta-barrel domain-containing protein [Flexibacter flexilis DSM 6793]|uniref:Outer membrane protein beta-barrel domain-containing protein n=1 Tax=Flexibacter flexilis DSM 6793 TaxID=927664 RepID=A0A1I1MDA1_9BACT|nr:outer membrane beta-barrel protein [Flexibacter flexilis]SFC82822.1 Outer membrane protein beta-barrel domain-containing protein [Flexibacter flexilis DSM 6793]